MAPSYNFENNIRTNISYGMVCQQKNYFFKKLHISISCKINLFPKKILYNATKITKAVMLLMKTNLFNLTIPLCAVTVDSS